MDTLPTVKPLNLPEGLTQQQLAQLARDVAMGMNELSLILQTHNLEEEDYDHIKTIPYYAAILQQYTEEWESVKNTPERVKFQSAAAYEILTPALTARLESKNEELKDVVQGMALLAKVGGLDSSKNSADVSTDKFTITINMGERKLEYVEATAPVTIEHERERPALQSFPQGGGQGSELPAIPKKS